ncbi:hypothetical protein QO021_28655 (plasmid) [Pseudomonas amygdali pv. lachrymans]|uniref:Uncharacterized protein n=1 Tax=Pseudomonas syringae pv. maculicola str. ES4326 TaxID=629265 RepID=A0A8T8CB41_PSEYM|nr:MULTISPECIES: hypothetical protein [Pseudomonas syringae group]QHF00742.1 hypothetical protein PMA4326_030085 [Pseudomonas syringae pv. maculicola str. ES4326]RMM39224.1 hypothetical protein ALQ79_200216 [Pseudomonas amygdali pv. lachrymans]UBZ00352.1 hypothetical protein LCG56_28715 [Pseudomonas cannabina pv. alisalensis]WIO61531.1 hypothetical protein QO021_28655 [Pseudomonas amygdali pv. lachrymans]
MEPSTEELLKTLQEMHPQLKWGTYPSCDYDMYAELDAPEVLVCFGSEDLDLEYGLVDPCSTFTGKRCSPSHWGISVEASEMIQAHNKVFVSKYPNCNGPKVRVEIRQP